MKPRITSVPSVISLLIALILVLQCYAEFPSLIRAQQRIDHGGDDITQRINRNKLRPSSVQQQQQQDSSTAAATADDDDDDEDDGVVGFQESFSVIWGDVVLDDPPSVRLKLDRTSGSGFVSLENYMYAYFSASIKLPQDYTAGIVLAFYTSNTDDFPKNHDELDFEFLGNVKGKPWRLQTNIYGNGSISRGREERFNLWFDPTTDFHTYSILWNHKHIVFFVDDIPIREMKKSKELGGDYPSKPMALYATMWDGSSWATNGGRYPINYKYAPFFTTFKNFKMNGCASNPILEEQIEIPSYHTRSKIEHCLDNPAKKPDLWDLTSAQQRSLEWVRTHYLYYTYCQDSARYYSTSLPECATQTKIRLTKPSGYKGHHTKQRARKKVDPSTSPAA